MYNQFDENKEKNDDKYKLCKSYPKNWILPSSLSDKEIISCSKYRMSNRMEALTYYHKGLNRSIWRSSQPK